MDKDTDVSSVSQMSKEDRIQNIGKSLKHLKDILFTMRENDMQIYEKLMGVESSIWRLKYSTQLETDIGSPRHDTLQTSISEESSYIFDDDFINEDFHNDNLRSLIRVQSEPGDHFDIGLETPPSCISRLSVCKSSESSEASSSGSPCCLRAADRIRNMKKDELDNERFLTILRIRTGSSNEREVRREIFI